MAAHQPSGAGPVPADVVEIQRALSRVAYLITRARQHDRTALEAGVPVTRAAVPILRLLAESGPLRPGAIATRLEVEPPHIARQVRLLEKAGHVERVPDPGDRRACRVRLTPSGQDAIGRVNQVARQQVLQALAGWTPQERSQLATLLSRMVDDFLAHMARDDPDTASVRAASGRELRGGATARYEA